MNCNPFHDPDPDFDRLYIFGAGGSGREVAWLAQQSWNQRVELVFLVDHPKYLCDQVHGIRCVLLDDINATESDRYVVAIGDPVARHSAEQNCENAGLIAATLMHPRVETSSNVVIGEDAVVAAGACITKSVAGGALAAGVSATAHSEE